MFGPEWALASGDDRGKLPTVSAIESAAGGASLRPGHRVRDVVLYGLGVWVVPFAVAMAAGVIRDDHRSLFESIMAVTCAATGAGLSVAYLSRHPGTTVLESFTAGMAWWAMSVAIDLPLMLPEPIGMSVGEYAADVGLTYLVYPVITTATGVLAARSHIGGR